MKDIIDKELKHLIWQDTLGDTFLITRYCEIFKYSDDILGLYVWDAQLNKFLQSDLGWVLKIDKYFDDPFVLYHIDRSKLDTILSFRRPLKSRPHQDGVWLERRKEILGHDIIKFRRFEWENGEDADPANMPPQLREARGL